MLTAMSTPTRVRQRNARGEGSLLRDDIVLATLAIIDREGGTAGVTLRAVAREVGIAAPSIYPHFPDADTILRAVVDQVFRQLIDRISDAVANISQAKPRLRAYCSAYLDFAAASPQRYKLLFARQPGNDVGFIGQRSGIGRDAFDILLDAVKEVGSHRHPMVRATAVWAGLHGIATLRAGVPQFAWPSNDALVRALLAEATP